MVIPGEFDIKKLYEWVKFEKKEISIPERGLRFGLKIAKTTIFRCRTELFFLWKKKLIIVFFGVKFTGDYRNVAIIPSLFRNHKQKSKKPNFRSFFPLLTVIPK